MKRHYWVRNGQKTYKCHKCGLERINESINVKGDCKYFRNNIEVKNEGCK